MTTTIYNRHGFRIQEHSTPVCPVLYFVCNQNQVTGIYSKKADARIHVASVLKMRKRFYDQCSAD